MKVLLLAWLWAACATDPVPEGCFSHSECAASEVCDEGTCRTQDCSTAESCPLGQTCREHACEPGCSEDPDCPAGEQCTSGQCTPRGCQDSTIDCPVGQECRDGTCVDARVCRTCAGPNACDPGEVCLWLTEGPDAYCWQTCQTVDDCPSGFGCFEVPSTGSKVCASDCDWLRREGWL